MTAAEMEAVIAELEAGLLAECSPCGDCDGRGVDERVGEPCLLCGGTGRETSTPAGERALHAIRTRKMERAARLLGEEEAAADGIWAREKRRAVEALGCEAVEARG